MRASTGSATWRCRRTTGPCCPAFEAAVAAAYWRSVDDLAGGLTNEPGTGSWPIVGASYVLVRGDGPESGRAAAFFSWAVHAGA